MSSATSLPGITGSTSTAAPPSATTNGSQKLAVVPRPQPLTAVRTSTGGSYELADGRQVALGPSDWVIMRGKAVIDVVADRLLRDRYQVVEQGALTVPLATCTQLESTLGIGATQSVERLVSAVERLAKIEVGTIKIDFTPGQLEEIATRAKKRNQTIPQALQAVVDRIREELFWRS